MRLIVYDGQDFWNMDYVIRAQLIPPGSTASKEQKLLLVMAPGEHFVLDDPQATAMLSHLHADAVPPPGLLIVKEPKPPPRLFGSHEVKVSPSNDPVSSPPAISRS